MTHTPRRRPIARRINTVALALGLLTLSACSEPTIEPQAAQSYTQSWAPTLEEALRQESAQAASSQALKERLSAAAQSPAQRAQADAPPFATLVDQVYQARDYEPALVKNAALTPAGEAVWNALQLVEDHQLDPAPYQLDQIAGLFDQLETQKQAYADFDELQPTEAEIAFASAWLTEQPVAAFDLSPENHARLTEALLAAPSGARLRDALQTYQQKSAQVVAVEVQLEELLAAGLARYAHQLRHFRLKEIFVHERHWDKYNEPDSRSTRPDEAKGPFRAGQVWRRASHVATDIANARKSQILHQGIKDTLASTLNAEGPEQARAGVDAIPPQQPQYQGLIKAFRRYRDIVEAGGWPEVPAPRSLKPGQSAPVVASLKQRLQIEGFYPADAPLDERYDDLLVDAVREYQHTHQMVANGSPHKVFWGSLNVPAERRLAQIALNIKRWRSTNIAHDEFDQYVFVNIPDFNVELWHEHERKLRFGIVVGNNNKEVNPLTGEAERANRTPTLAAYIDRIIYNPYWNVTPRIRAESIIPKVHKHVTGAYASRLSALLASAKPAPALAPAAGALRAPQAPTLTANRAPGMVGRPPAAAQPTAQPTTPAAAQPAAPATDPTESLTTMRSTDAGRVRAFKTDALRRILEHHFPGEEGLARFRAQFPYLDPHTGLVDVSTTNPDHIPSWYEANGYEVAFPGRTWEYVRMLPGGDNALGFVKIIFPNLQDIYLHDTPHKPLFSRPVRGFSHGCIRMEQPLNMAETLLQLDGQNPDIDRILEKGDYNPIFLKHQVPVFIEYYTVRVDDEGRPHFLADIYNYDELG
ncbi:hypothetical protein DL240_15365 [Lujinxingia litoralis]|uniref:Uncharacterized protein n=1 Tax=Lujinxingia litoralis TaxID=2211119 RepID=A0A328C4D4_9DELT|nr:L,D-transpeptidase family protein [Lujinxingia litoralis]RAL20695.1 hypothetical protein DL240_15365 [Lujinxingia litoralis]